MMFRCNINNYINIIISKNKNGFQCVIHTLGRVEKSQLIREWSDVEIVLSWKGTCFMKFYSCLRFICYVKCLFCPFFPNFHSLFHFCRCNNFIILKVLGVYEPLKIFDVLENSSNNNMITQSIDSLSCNLSYSSNYNWLFWYISGLDSGLPCIMWMFKNSRPH